MKLFTSIAAAAVIGGSFLIPVPAEARNGWSHVSGNSYAKPLGCRGSMCTAMINNNGDTYRQEFNCSAWTYKVPGGQWRPIMPQSVAEVAANQVVCR